jgi:cohesin complex subunit SCC1
LDLASLYAGHLSLLLGLPGIGPIGNVSRDSRLSLGLVKDFGAEEDDDVPRQDAGDDAVTSTTKWHNHTLKVYKLLTANMSAEGNSALPHCVTFQELVQQQVSRRTAAGVFFELLQLKTWDFIDLDQDESYSIIMVRTL